ncbi:IniB N-terminal domain-containing protein [Prauserella cavernicola]|uniref:IniB N-terminal domain-containing protein n=1 Tax=Prauserella cavernicola TaxID=2800127 RepID=A0A934V792_9PSEU|nr:IniB N-terminal domain-containing protein [Prauserella cavernicola]MBK1787000.1 IniB N-terminal domain-containing protein [Prauserella cavernicola]
MPEQNLYDFALNLLTDPEARSAFDAAPQDVLNGAGLGDITPGDVQEILPLVLDSTQIQTVDSITQDLGVENGFSSVNDLAQSLDSTIAGGDIAGGDVAGAVTGAVEDVAVGGAGVGAVENVTGLAGFEGLDDLTAGASSVGDLNAVTGDVANAVEGGDLGVGDIAPATTVAPVAQDVVGDVASGIGEGAHVGQLSEVGNVGQVAGDAANLDVGGVLNGNDIDF